MRQRIRDLAHELKWAVRQAAKLAEMKKHTTMRNEEMEL